MKKLKLLIFFKLILLLLVMDSSVLAQGQSGNSNRERSEQVRKDSTVIADSLRRDTMRQNRGGEQRGRGQDISREAREDGRAFGQRMSEEARQQRMNRAEELGSAESKGRDKAEEARERIENAQTNLENARSEGRVSEEEFTERMNKINRAKEKLNSLEDKLNRGREMRRTAEESIPEE